MSVAALKAVALGHTLAGGGARLAARYFEECGKIVDVAWNLAVGRDLALPEVTGKRPLALRLSNASAELVLKAAEKDVIVAEVSAQ